MLSDDIKNILATAGTCASKLGHDEITLTHLMFVICESGKARSVFEYLHFEDTAYRDDLFNKMISDVGFPIGGTGHLRLSPAVAACIDTTQTAANSRNEEFFTVDDLALSILFKEFGSDADDYARNAFIQLDGMKHYEVMNGQSSGTSAPVAEAVAARAPDTFMFQSLFEEDDARNLADKEQNEQKVDATPKVPVDPAAMAWCVDLVAQAEAGLLDHAYGREIEIKRMCEILGRRTKNNPILIGEAGVGKTAAVEGLALMIASGTAPSFLSRSRILALDLGRLASGTGNRGDLEKRVTAIIDVMKRDPRVILFIDEIHSLVGGMNALQGVADLMKPALAGGTIRCIGATTHDEFSRHFDKDPALVRRFQEISVSEPTRDQAVDIMKNIAETYAAHHGVRYTDEALTQAVDLSIRYLVNRHLPDKAIDILDEAGSMVRGSQYPVVTSETVVEVVRKMTRDRFLENGDTSFWEGLASDFEGRIVQHGHACGDIVSFLQRMAAHPVARGGAKAAFLLRGQPGIGKAFMAETLAALLGIPFLKIEMGNYAERHSATGLIGAPPGYLGYDEGGKLTEFVKRQPLCVILFDKFERAHSSSREIVETALGEGTLLDARGRKINFRNVIGFVSMDDDKRAEPIGFFGSRDEDASGIQSQIRYDRTFDLDLIGRKAGLRLVSSRMQTLAAAYASSGSTVLVPDDVIEAIVTAGGHKGGKANDFDKAYSELFEAELFRHHVGAGEVLKFSLEASGRIVATVEVSNEIFEV